MKKTKQREKSGLEKARICARAALDKKGEDVLILDVRELCSFTDYFVIVSGRSTRHVQGLAEGVDAGLRQKKIRDSNTEGLQDGLWVLLDYNDVLVHLFYKETRPFYDLEGLWHDATPVSVEPKDKGKS